MRTLALTLASDGDWIDAASVMAKRFESLNQIECRILGPDEVSKIDIAKTGDEDRKSTWLKAYLWDIVPENVGTIIWVDADIIPLRPVPVHTEKLFAARLDAGRIPEEALQIPFFSPIIHYFNSGYFIAKRATRPAFEKLKTLRDHEIKGPSGGEQSWLNLCVQEHIGADNIEILPSHISYMTVDGPMPSNVGMIHLAGIYENRFVFLKLMDGILHAIEQVPHKEFSGEWIHSESSSIV